MSHNSFERIVCFTIGCIVGLLAVGLILSPYNSNDAEKDRDRAFELIAKYKAMIERDDRILNMFMNGNWDRSQCLYVEPEYRLANGDWVKRLSLVDCDFDKEE